ncbi:MAG: hypothetical protein H6602_01210 [Flavobacteriales bacterium]|nr:hypothetical protein [Flavobacteriales bacterium]
MERYKLWYGLILLFLVWLIYWPTLRYGYNVDDYLVVENNLAVQSGMDGIPKLLTSYYKEVDGERFEWRPTTKITYAVEYEMFGEKPGISHGINVVLYLTVIATIWTLLTSNLPETSQQRTIFLALVLFAVHPLHVEVVASLKNREVLLSSLFGLIALVLMFRKKREYWPENKASMTIALAFLFLSLMTKVSGMVFFLMAPILNYLFNQGDLIKTVKFSSLLTVPFATYTIILILFFPDSFSRAYKQPYFESHLSYIESTTEYFATAFYTVYFNAKQLLLGSPLSFFYGYAEIGIYSWEDVTVWLGVAIMILVLFSALKSKKWPVRIAGIFVFPTMVLFSNLLLPVPGGVADRILFLPVLGVSIGICHWTGIIAKNLPKTVERSLFGVVLLLIIGYYTHLSIERVALWKDRMTLVESDLQNYPESAVGHLMLAQTYLEESDKSGLKSVSDIWLEKSIVEWKRFVSIYPPMGNFIYFQIGRIYQYRLNNPQAALKCYQFAISSWNLNNQSPNFNNVLPTHRIAPIRIRNQINMVSELD